MNEALSQLIATLDGGHGRISAALAWIAAARLALKPFNAFFLAWFHRIVVSLESDPDPFIAEFAARVMQNKAYKVLAWLLDTAVSIKLPTVNSLNIHKLTTTPNQNEKTP